MKTFADNVCDAMEWINNTNGAFHANQLFTEAVITESHAGMRNDVVKNLVSSGIIQPYGQRHGWYVKSDNSAPVMDWANANISEYPIYMPLGLSKRVVISPGNVIVGAGEKNAGKSEFAYNTIFNNLSCNGGDHDQINLFDYESHPAELKGRFMRISPNMDQWRGLVVRKRLNDFHKVIDPDGFNIIDYLKIGGTKAAFTDAGRLLEEIHSVMRNGIVIVLIQKKRGEEFAKGGELTLEEARLGVSFFAHGPSSWARITKCKFPRIYPNPQEMEIDYTINEEGRFITDFSEWRYVTKKEREKMCEENMLREREGLLSRRRKENAF